jgi:transposase-like protein
MRKSKFSETQIVAMLKDAESGVPVADLTRKHGVSKATFFKWRSKYGGATVSDVKRLRELEVGECEAETDVCGPRARERCHQGCAEPKAVRPFANDRSLRRWCRSTTCRSSEPVAW